MQNWTELRFAEEKAMWAKVHKELHFKPSIYPKDWPSLQLREPYIIYDIRDDFDYSRYEELYKDLEEKMIKVFKKVTLENESIIVLDWQHVCYHFNPRLETIKNEFDRGPVPLLPEGDYCFFIQKDFQWGYLGHPWEKTVSVFGEALITQIEQNKPDIFNTAFEKRNG